MKTEDIDKRIGMPDVNAEWEKFEREVIDKETSSHKNIIIWGLSIAASIALLAGIFLLMPEGQVSDTKMAERVPRGQVSVPRGQVSGTKNGTTDGRSDVPEGQISGTNNGTTDGRSDGTNIQETVQRPAPELLAMTSPSTTEGKKEDNDNKAVEKPDKVFSVVEQNPIFPGGNRALQEFIKTNRRYPDLAMEYGAKGRVITTFLIDSLGYASDFKIQRCILQYDSLRLSQETEERQEQVKELIAQQLGEESKRILSLMPRWSPGKMYGKTRSVRYVLPIQFQPSEAERQ